MNRLQFAQSIDKLIEVECDEECDRVCITFLNFCRLHESTSNLSLICPLNRFNLIWFFLSPFAPLRFEIQILISTFTAWRTFRRPTIASWKGTHFQSIALESKTLGHWHAFNRWRLNSLPDGQSMAAISADVRRTPETTKITEIAVKADQTFGITSANPLQREWKAALTFLEQVLSVLHMRTQQTEWALDIKRCSAPPNRSQ